MIRQALVLGLEPFFMLTTTQSRSQAVATSASNDSNENTTARTVVSAFRV